jgi:hypothetical protein
MERVQTGNPGIIPVSRCVDLSNFSALLLGLKEACCAAARRHPSSRVALRSFFGSGRHELKIGGSPQKLTGIIQNGLATEKVQPSAEHRSCWTWFLSPGRKHA